jgi:hypothetical protein
MRVVKIKIIKGNPEEYNHYEYHNATTICGEDTGGDNDIEMIRGKITCPRCISIIKTCKLVRARDISQKDL